MAPEERKSRDRGSGGTIKWWGYLYSWRKLYLPCNISPGKNIFPLHLPHLPHSLLATVLTSKHNGKIFPQKGNFSLHISLLFPHSPYSQLATFLHFKHNDKIFPQKGNFLRENFPPAGKVSLLTVGNNSKFKCGAGWGGGHVTWEVEGVILFLAKRLPPLGQSYPITTHVRLLRWTLWNYCVHCVTLTHSSTFSLPISRHIRFHESPALSSPVPSPHRERFTLARRACPTSIFECILLRFVWHRTARAQHPVVH